jgi:hypothetical protein
MSFRLPDGILDRTHSWVNEQDMREYDKAFQSLPGEDQRMQMALLCADPSTPEDFIRAKLSNPMMPPRYGYTNMEPDLDDVLSIGSARTRSSSPGSPQMGVH